MKWYIVFLQGVGSVKQAHSIKELKHCDCAYGAWDTKEEAELYLRQNRSKLTC